MQQAFSDGRTASLIILEQKSPRLLGLVWETRLFFLERMKDAFSQQRKAHPAIALSFDQFQFRHLSLDHAVVDPPGETSSHCIFVFLDPSRKGLEFGKLAACYFVQPSIEVLSGAGAQHLGKLLHQLIGQSDFRVDLTERGLAAPAPQHGVFRGDDRLSQDRGWNQWADRGDP